MAEEDSFEYEAIKIIEEQTRNNKESLWIDQIIDKIPVKSGATAILSDESFQKYHLGLRKHKAEEE